MGGARTTPLVEGGTLLRRPPPQNIVGDVWWKHIVIVVCGRPTPSEGGESPEAFFSPPGKKFSLGDTPFFPQEVIRRAPQTCESKISPEFLRIPRGCIFGASPPFKTTPGKKGLFSPKYGGNLFIFLRRGIIFALSKNGIFQPPKREGPFPGRVSFGIIWGGSPQKVPPLLKLNPSKGFLP